MAGSILGTAVRRVEDPTILVGTAQYVDDVAIEGVLHLIMVRSTMAHARIISIDTSAARTMPGVVAVFTAADIDLPLDTGMMQINPTVARPMLATDKVRFVGDIVAAVVATSRAAGTDAAEAVIVDYDPLPAVVDVERALAPDAPLQFDDLGTNLVTSTTAGNDPDPLAGADVVVRGRFVNQRVAIAPLEGHAIAVIPGDDGKGHLLTIYLATQMPHMVRDRPLVRGDLEPAQVRVIAGPFVGGGFGGKVLNTEYLLTIHLARHLGRPLKWIETRTENLTSAPAGRGQIQYVEMGFRTDGTIVGLRCRFLGDAGAYAGFGGSLVAGPTRMMAQGVYKIPKISFQAAVVTTNTAPMAAYRGAGRPEAAAFLERIIDLAADDLGLDPVEIRRRNFIGPDEFPFTTQMGTTYDNGDYDLPFREALRIADYDALLAEQAARRERNDPKLLGIGLATYVEITGFPGSEYGDVEVHPDGTVTVRVGTSAHGQGHATAFSMLVADRLQVPMASIRFVQSDTAEVPRGGGTGGSRSLQYGGNAVAGAADLVVERAKALAAERLEADPSDIVLTDDGRLGVAGVPARALSWAELATSAAEADEPLRGIFDFTTKAATFPFGAHVAVVEIDRETGFVTLLRHVAVDDCGRIVNPLLVAGQQHGGIGQGASQALYEEVVYDDAGNPLTSTLADYCFPSAAEFPSFETSNTETPTPVNPLGAKGIGESATIGSTPAIQNAVVDALSHLGVRHLDMPCTPQRIYAAIEAAAAGTLSDPWRKPPAVFEHLPTVDVPDAAEELNL